MRLDRVGIWVVNAALFVLCCYLVADVGIRVLTETALPEAAPAAAAGAADARVARTWQDRQVILDRNLFNASVLAPAAPVEPVVAEEDLEETRLPLKLLGTAAAADSRLSWAAVEDLEERRHVVVRVGDRLKQDADVVRIERKRIVLQNGPNREELTLQEDDSAPSPVARRTPTRPRRRIARAEDRAERIRRLSENRFAVDRDDIEETMRNPAELFSQARILPKYEDGSMVGVQLNNVQSGSLFEEIGIQNGDTITELNGIPIDSPEQSAELLRELAQAEEFNVIVSGADGRQRTLNFVPRN